MTFPTKTHNLAAIFIMVAVLIAVFVQGSAQESVRPLLTANWLMPYIAGQARFDTIWVLIALTVSLAAWSGLALSNGTKGILFAAILAANALTISSIAIYVMDTERSTSDIESLHETEMERALLLSFNNRQEPIHRVPGALDLLFLPNEEVHQRWMDLGLIGQLDALDDFRRKGVTAVDIREGWKEDVIKAGEPFDVADLLYWGVRDRGSFLYGVIAATDDVRFTIRATFYSAVIFGLGVVTVLASLGFKKRSLGVLAAIPAFAVLPIGEAVYYFNPSLIIPVFKVVGLS